MNFEYKNITKSYLTIITFKGRMSREAAEKLKICQQEIAALDTKHIILLFKDVTGIDQVACRDLTLLQQEVRKNKKLYLAGLHKDLKQMLIEKGMIREKELRESLEEALRTLEE